MPLETKNSEQKKEGAAQTVGAFVWDIAKIIIVSLAIIVPFRMFIAEPFVVSGNSMAPNFHNRDYLIIDRLTYRDSLPQRGDVIVLKFPKDTSQFLIKRIIGLPGEKVKISGGYVTVFNSENPEGLRLREPYLPEEGKTLGASDLIELGSEEYFVLGDNRGASSDSRVWGILPKADIVGKVWLRALPVSDFNFFSRPEYKTSATPQVFNFTA